MAFLGQRNSEVVLGSGPFLGQVGLGDDLKRLFEGLHSLVEQRSGLFAAGTLRLVRERTPEIDLRRGPVLGQIGFGADLQCTAIRLHRLTEQYSGLVSAGPLCLVLERHPEAVLRRRALPRIAHRGIVARQRLEIVRGLIQQAQALARGRHLTLSRARGANIGNGSQPQLVKTPVVRMLLVFGSHGGFRVFEGLRGLVILQVELIRAGCLLAVVEELLQRASLLAEKRLLRGLERLDLSLQGLLLRIVGVDLLSVGVAGRVEQLRGSA